MDAQSVLSDRSLYENVDGDDLRILGVSFFFPFPLPLPSLLCSPSPGQPGQADLATFAP